MARAAASSSSVDIVSYALDSSEKYDENRPIYVDAESPENHLTAAQTRILTRKLVAGLIKHAGVRPGDRVIVHLPSVYFFSSIIFAIIGSQGVYTASNPAYKEFELKHILEVAQPAVLITSNDLLPVVSAAVREKNIDSSCIYVLDTAAFEVGSYLGSVTTESASVKNGTSSSHEPQRFEKLLECGETGWHRTTSTEALRETHAAMFSTSGTTGLPKLAVFTHASLIEESETIFSVCPRNVVRLLSLPLFLKYGFTFGHVPSMRYGSPVYILPRFKMDSFLQSVKQFKVTELTLVPAMVSGMLRACEPDMLKEAFESVRFVAIGGGTLAEEVFAAFQSVLNMDATIAHGWGLTETGPLTITRSRGREAIGSIGSPFPGISIKLLDEDGAVVTQDGVHGTAWSRSASVFSGYRNPDGSLTRPLDNEGFFCTGDILTWRGKDLCYVGRSKELIKVKSWQVAPAEIEGLLMTHPDIADCAVKGVHTEFGDRPRAYVVLKTTVRTKNAEVMVQDIYGFAKGRLANYKALDGGVQFVDAVPRNAMGKMQKHLL